MKSLFVNSLSFCLTIFFLGCNPQKTSDLQRQLDEANNKISELTKAASEEELKPIQEAATVVLRDFPTQAQIESSRNLNEQEKLIFTEIRNVIVRTSDIKTITKKQLEGLANEISWMNELVTAIAKAKAPNNPDKRDCASRCADEYDSCKDGHCGKGHRPSWYGCLCCMPCSLQYMGCTGRCTITGVGF
jgi:hypothetical protein